MDRAVTEKKKLKCHMLTEVILDEISPGLNVLLRNPSKESAQVIGVSKLSQNS
jgi:hypothetical protein